MSLRSRSVAAILLGAAFLAGCGDEGLPNENGVYWNCFGQLTFTPSESQGETIGTIGQVGRVCGNPDVPESEVRDACEDQCAGDFFDLLVDIGEKVVTAGQGGHDCAIDSVQKTAQRCRDPLVEPAGGGPALYSFPVESSSSPLSVTIEDITGTTSLSGWVRYTVPETCTAACSIVIADLSLTAANFDFDGDDVTGASIISYGNIVGSLFPDGHFTLPAGSLRMSANFDYLGEHGSITAFNDRTIEGSLNRTTGLFTLGEATVAGGGATIRFRLQGHVASRPPHAVATLPASVECDRSGAGAVTLDGTQSSATSGALVEHLWSVLPPSPPFSGNYLFLGRGASLTSALPVGSNLVELLVFDSNGAADAASASVNVVDTTRPTIVAATQGKITNCSPGAEEVTIAVPTVTDVCDPAPELTAAIIAKDGQALATPIPVVGGRVSLSQGDYEVRFTARDAAGNVSTLDQALHVVSTPTLYATAGLSLGAMTVVSLLDGGFGTIVNSGATQTTLDARAQVGDVLSVGRLQLRNGARVNGFVRTTTPIAADLNAVVLGPVFVEQSLVLPDFPSIAVPPASFGSQPVEVPAFQETALAPGAYGPVRVAPGSTLALSSGSYYVTSLRLEPGATIRVHRPAGPVQLYVRDELMLQGRITDAAGAFPDILVGYLGSSTVFVQGDFRGTLIAPSAPVEVATAYASVEGGIFARTIRVQPETTIVHHPFGCTP